MKRELAARESANIQALVQEDHRQFELLVWRAQNAGIKSEASSISAENAFDIDVYRSYTAVRRLHLGSTTENRTQRIH